MMVIPAGGEGRRAALRKGRGLDPTDSPSSSSTALASCAWSHTHLFTGCTRPPFLEPLGVTAHLTLQLGFPSRLQGQSA